MWSFKPPALHASTGARGGDFDHLSCRFRKLGARGPWLRALQMLARAVSEDYRSSQSPPLSTVTLNAKMQSILPYSNTHASFPFFESSYSTDDYGSQTSQAAASSHNGTYFGSESFGHIPAQPAFPGGDWSAVPHTSWNLPLDTAGMNWDTSLQPSYASSPSSSHDPYTPSFGYDTSAEFDAYSPPSATSSEIESSTSFEHVLPQGHYALPHTPSVPSSSQEIQPAPRQVRRLSKESLKSVVADRKYTCDFCPVQMARLHDINRHMRIHTGVHPYACIGCGETFRRTDARTRHWCKSPECFNVHSAKTPLSKARRRIP